MPNLSDVRIRLTRLGRRHRPVYRIIVAHHYAPRDGKFLEILGTYDPHPDSVRAKHVRLNVHRFQHWIACGASPTETVARIASKFNLLPPQPIRVNMPLADVKPELVPRPTLPKLPGVATHAERYFSSAVAPLRVSAAAVEAGAEVNVARMQRQALSVLSGSGLSLGAMAATKGSIGAAKRGMLF